MTDICMFEHYSLKVMQDADEGSFLFLYSVKLCVFDDRLGPLSCCRCHCFSGFVYDLCLILHGVDVQRHAVGGAGVSKLSVVCISCHGLLSRGVLGVSRVQHHLIERWIFQVLPSVYLLNCNNLKKEQLKENNIILILKTNLNVTNEFVQIHLPILLPWFSSEEK